MSPLESDQLDFFGRLYADPYFADIGIYVVRPRQHLSATEIYQKIENALKGVAATGGKSGAAVCVMMPFGGDENPEIIGPRIDEVITVRVQEFVLVNMGTTGTLKSCEEIALKVVRLLHHFYCGTGGVWKCDRSALQPRLDFIPFVTYDCNFKRELGLARLAKVNRPRIIYDLSTDPAHIQVTCDTDGATIYYTLDGTYPSSIAPTATLYTTDLYLSSACVLRVAAELAGSDQSDVATLPLSVAPTSGTVADPTLEVDLNGNPYIASIACATTGATIFYTTDKTDPIVSATKHTYSAPFSVVADGLGVITIRAFAIKSGMAQSTGVQLVVYPNGPPI